jgi:SAM-dependent methyltransferase
MNHEIPTYVDTTAERTPTYQGGYSLFLDSLIDDTKKDLLKKYSIDHQFNFPTFRNEGVAYFHQLNQAVKNGDEESIPNLIEQINKFTVPPLEQRPDAERWAHMAVQLPGDWGVLGENKTKLKKIVTDMATGRVLEPMAGFFSYFDDTPNISEVIALDFCKEALERHDHANRTRILYDLEEVCHGEKIPFFKDDYFQTIGIFFGVNYLTDPLPVYQEFNRILSQDGKILIVGGTKSGYSDLNKRWFNPEKTATELQKNNFTTSIRHLDVKEESQNTEYYLISGIKK